jgi:hypothetical protein
MIKLSLAIIFYLTNFLVFSQEPAYKWVSTASEATIESSDIDSLGNVVTIGKFNGTSMNFGNAWIAGSSATGSASMYIAKYSSTGKLLWAQSVFGTNASSAVIPIKVTVNIAGEIAVLSYIQNTSELQLGKLLIPLKNNDDKLLIIKYNKLGRILWFRMLEAKSTEMTYLEGTDIAMDNLGNVYCTGSFAGDSLIIGKDYIAGKGLSNLFFVSKFNALGLLNWLKTCDYENSAETTSIKSKFMLLSVSGIIIGGDYIGNSNYYFNKDTLTGDTGVSAYVAKMDFNGNFLWAKAITGTQTEFIDGIATDLSGNLYVTGLFNSPALILDTASIPNSSANYDLFIAKLSEDGKVLWKESIDVQIDVPDLSGKNAVLNTDLAGNTTIVTRYMGKTVLHNAFLRSNANEGTRDLLIFRISNEGAFQWVQTGNSMVDDWINSVTFDRLGSVYILCPVPSATVTFDTYTVTDALGYGGFYIVKINPFGIIRFLKPNFNVPDGILNGQQIKSDLFGNIYMQGYFLGNKNTLGTLNIQSPEANGLFFSKLSYYTTVSGKVYNQNGSLMDGGIVKLYGYTRFQRSPISDSTFIQTDGTYLLTNVPFGRYIIYAYPRKVSNPMAVPTYYPGGANWQEATTLLIETSEPITNIDIRLKEIPQANGGATMGGMVFEADTTNVFKSTGEIMAKPIKKADVILRGRAKSTGNVIAYTTTDDNGDFAFFNIPDGDYTVEVDIPGLPHASYHDVSITGGELIMNLDYLVGEEFIYAQNGPNIVSPYADNHDNLLLFPNPCSQILYIKNAIIEDKNLQVEIYNLAGICVFSKSVEIIENTGKLDISSLKEGLYFIKIKSTNINYLDKILIK